MNSTKPLLLFLLVVACSGRLEQSSASEHDNVSSQALTVREVNSQIIERVRADLAEIERRGAPEERNRARGDRYAVALAEVQRDESMDLEARRITAAAIRSTIYGAPDAEADAEAELTNIAAQPEFELEVTEGDIRNAEALEAVIREREHVAQERLRQRRDLRVSDDAQGRAEPPMPEDERVFN